MKKQRGMTIAWVILVIIVVLGALGIGYYYYQVNQKGQAETAALQEEILEQKAENVDLADENQAEEAKESGEADETSSNWKEVTIKSMGFQITLTDNWSGYRWQIVNGDLVIFSLPIKEKTYDGVTNDGDGRANVLRIKKIKSADYVGKKYDIDWIELAEEDGYKYIYLCNEISGFHLADGTKIETFNKNELGYPSGSGTVIPSFKLI